MAKYTRILSIDGGGIRGIIPAQVLVSLEKLLQELTKDTNTRISDYFDLIAGTSTGGILTCALLVPALDVNGKPTDRPEFTASDALDLYVQNGDDIFDVGIFKKISSLGGIADEKYSAKGLEKVLEEYFGNLLLSQLLKPCLVTTYDIKHRRAMFFTQHDAISEPDSNFLVRDLCRATSAAPTFFEVARIKSTSRKAYPTVDGGIFANNPSLCAYAEARAATILGNPEAKDMVILSLGTGNYEKSYTHKEVKDWGSIGWIGPLISMMMSGVSETVDYQLRQIFDTTSDQDHYLRLQLSRLDENGVPDPNIPDFDYELDNASAENIEKLVRAGNYLAVREKQKLTKFAELLLQ